MSLDILAFGAKEMRPLCIPPGEETAPFGRMTAARWTTLAKQMTDTQTLDKNAPDPKTAFRAEFLPKE